MSAQPNKPARQRELAQIHIAKKDLRLDEETYRCMLKTIARVDSAARLDHAGRRAVLDHLRGLGWRPGHRRTVPRGSAARGTEALIGKVEALLTDAGRPWGYAHEMARRMFHIKRVQWLTGEQLRKLVAALAIDQRRRNRG